LNDTVVNGKTTNAAGLYQITETNARRLGYTPQQIQNSSADKQTEIFLKYINELFGKQSKNIETFSDLVMLWAGPKHIGAEEDKIVYKAGGDADLLNPSWDTDGIPGISKKEIVNKYKEGLDKTYIDDDGKSIGPATTSSIYSDLNKRMRDDIWSIVDNTIDPIEKLSRALAVLKVNVDAESLDTFGASAVEMLQSMATEFRKQWDYIDQRKKEGAGPEELAMLNKSLRASRKEFEKMAKALTDLQNKGKAFNDNFFGILQEGMSGLLTGDIEDYGDFGRGLLDKFTKGVVDDFLEGFMQPIKDTDALKGVGVQMASLANTFGEKVAGWLTGVSKPMEAPSIGESTKSEKSGLFSDWKKTADASVAGSAEAICACMKGGGGGGAYPGSNAAFAGKDAGKEAPLGANEDMFGVLADGLKDSEAPIKEAGKGLAETTSNSISGVFSEVSEGIGALAKSVGGEISAVIGQVIVGIQAILGIIDKLGGFAEGGKIVGGGSGTSDSILARVSNGEFIVNAKSTKKFSPILEAINSGDYLKGMKGFAMGGVVGASVLAMPIALSSESVTSRGNQQVINMNITGDISRQTKAEIYKMLPQIASGVNSVNHNRGSFR
jgi:hypothetical protein